MFKGPRTYRVQRADREPLVRFMLEALEIQGCRIIFASEPNQAPFVITFETPSGERMGNRQLLAQKRELFSWTPTALGFGATLADVATRHAFTGSRRISIPNIAPTIMDISRAGATRLSGAPISIAVSTRM
jgi:hypothetical protein